MFNLYVATEKLEKFRDLLNDINSNYRVGEKNEDGSVTLKFKTQEEFDKANEVLKIISNEQRENTIGNKAPEAITPTPTKTSTPTPTPTATRVPTPTPTKTPTPTATRVPTPTPTRTPTPTPTKTPIRPLNYSRSSSNNISHTNWGLLRSIIPSNIANWGS